MRYGTDAIVFFAEYDRDSFHTSILRLCRSLTDDMKEIQFPHDHDSELSIAEFDAVRQRALYSLLGHFVGWNNASSR
jgi:hypothetical protein